MAQPARQAAPARPAISFTQPAGPAAAPGRSQAAAFKNVGRTAITAIGPISGRHYRFSQPGAVVLVDPRDRASLATVPGLRQV